MPGAGPLRPCCVGHLPEHLPVCTAHQVWGQWLLLAVCAGAVREGWGLGPSHTCLGYGLLGPAPAIVCSRLLVSCGVMQAERPQVGQRMCARLVLCWLCIRTPRLDTPWCRPPGEASCGSTPPAA